jgi:hypothetical protein
MHSSATSLLKTKIKELFDPGNINVPLFCLFLIVWLVAFIFFTQTSWRPRRAQSTNMPQHVLAWTLFYVHLIGCLLVEWCWLAGIFWQAVKMMAASEANSTAELCSVALAYISIAIFVPFFLVLYLIIVGVIAVNLIACWSWRAHFHFPSSGSADGVEKKG